MPGSVEQVSYKTIEENTYLSKEAMWFDSFARNLPWIRDGKNIKELMGQCKGPCVVVGAGPSVFKFDHLTALKSVRAHVLATDRMLAPLVAHGVKPEISVTVDGAPEIAKFYEDPHSWGVPAVLPVYAHQPLASLVEKAYWYVPVLDDNWHDPKLAPRSVTRAMVEMAGHSLAGSAYGNAGGFAWSLAQFMGHDPVVLVGIDFSYGPGVSPMETPFWKGFLERRGGRKADVLRLDFRYEDNPFGHRVLSDKTWDGYRDVFLKGVERNRGTTVNCSEYTTLHGPGIRTMEFAAAVKEFGL